MTTPSTFAGAIRRIVELVLLAGFTVGVYAAVVIGGGAMAGTAGRPNVVLAMIATALIAVALPPVRARAQGFAARVAVGADENFYEVLVRAAEQFGSALSPETALPHAAAVVARGTGAARAEVWLRVTDRLRLVAAWPDEHVAVQERPLPAHGAPEFPGATHAAPVLDRGDIAGALAVYVDDRPALEEVEKVLLESLASHAGLVLRDIALTAELQDRLDTIEAQALELEESRRRILGAQADERRRLERAIHDGPQQHLVSLAVKLRLARTMLSNDAEQVRHLLSDVRADIDAALAALRELARGIYPPILSDGGIAAALESHAARVPYEVRIVDHTAGRRFDPAIEATVYFCCAEALRPALGPSDVTLAERAGALTFEIVHDRAIAPPGSLRHLEDRVASFDGVFDAAPRALRGLIPLPAPHGAP